jgi:uncharacterized protein
VGNCAIPVDGNTVTLLGDYRSNGWSGQANYVFTVDNNIYKTRENNMSNWVSGKNKVTFDSHGSTLTGNLFLPENFNPNQRYVAVVVGGTWTSIKEQMSDRYAQRLAENGFIALDYDFRGYGESAGEPRQFESAKLKTQDNLSAIGYLASLPFVDVDKIGALGICASAMYMSNAVTNSPQVKSLALVAPWIHNSEIVHMVYGGEEGVKSRLDSAQKAKQAYDASGEVQYVPACDPNDMSSAMPFALDFYLNPNRSGQTLWTNKFAVMAWEEWLNLDGVKLGAQIKVPTLIVHSEEGAVPMGAREFFGHISAPKDIFWTQGTQTDFYDQEPQVRVAVDAVVNHFKRTL